MSRTFNMMEIVWLIRYEISTILIFWFSVGWSVDSHPFTRNAVLFFLYRREILLTLHSTPSKLQFTLQLEPSEFVVCTVILSPETAMDSENNPACRREPLSLQSPNWNSSNNMHDSLLFARLQLACMPPLHRTHTVSTSASTSPSEACLLNNSFSLTFRQQIQLTFALQAWASNDNARCLPSDSVLILPLSLPDLGAHRHCEPWKRKF